MKEGQRRDNSEAEDMASMPGHRSTASTSTSSQHQQQQQQKKKYGHERPGGSVHQLYGRSHDHDGQSSSTGGPETSPQSGQKVKMDEGSPEWGLTKAGKKRQRLPLACQVCRKKKVAYYGIMCLTLDSLFWRTTNLQTLPALFVAMCI